MKPDQMRRRSIHGPATTTTVAIWCRYYERKDGDQLYATKFYNCRRAEDQPSSSLSNDDHTKTNQPTCSMFVLQPVAWLYAPFAYQEAIRINKSKSSYPDTCVDHSWTNLRLCSSVNKHDGLHSELRTIDDMWQIFASFV